MPNNKNNWCLDELEKRKRKFSALASLLLLNHQIQCVAKATIIGEINMHHKKLGLAAALALTLAAPITLAEEAVVNIYNWSDYIDPAILEKFETQTGIKINYDVYDSNEVLEAKLMSGSTGYDVVMPTGSFLERQALAGVYAEIDRSQLQNIGNLDAEMASKVALHDAGNKHNVPYTWGTIGLGYNVDMVKARLGDMPVNSWDLVFDPAIAAKLSDCGVSVLDSPAEVMSVALNYLGLDPNSEKKSDLKKATKLISASRESFTKFSSSQYISDLANGELCVSMGYNGDVLQSQSRAIEAGQGINISYIIPKEGSLVWFDLMAIPADAPHKEAAHKFIDFILQPENAAGVSNYAFYAVPNNKVEPYLLEEVKNDPSIYPTDDIKEKLFTQKAHSVKFDRLLTRAWTNIKTARQ
ncbi:putrescine ABC transporter, periplasmic putrescine-binding protein [Marinomonas sp. MED121]|nr:putrescine ABC transporter, periplasmic putrescine-binding protein [Marinomonas sp. MED121]